MCPFWKKPCEKVKSCHLRRKGLKYFNDNRKPEPFEECVFLLNCDTMENLVMRMIGVQKSTEGSRNQTNQLLQFFEELAKVKALEGR